MLLLMSLRSLQLLEHDEGVTRRVVRKPRATAMVVGCGAAVTIHSVVRQAGNREQVLLVASRCLPSSWHRSRRREDCR